MPLFKLMADDAPCDLSSSQIFSIIQENPTINVLITEMANRLFTVCAIFYEYPYV